MDITQNLWWSWQLDARELFHRIDHRLWEGTRHNAVEFLRQVAPDRLEHRAKDPAFLEQYDRVIRRFGLLSGKDDTWFATHYPELLNRSIAYFSAEFALHRSLPIYSGGLGVLAGDHCKEASDLGVPLVGVGLYYHGGYFDQRIGLDGWQRDSDDPVDPTMNPAARVFGPDGGPCLATVTISGREVQIGAWRVMVDGNGAIDMPDGEDNLFVVAARAAAKSLGHNLGPQHVIQRSAIPGGRGLGASAAAAETKES